ncbi:MAG: glycosyltransferase family 39 protein [Bacteroidia bacterium]
MPGYGTIYVVLWALSRDKSIAREWLVILQILLAAVAAALFGDLISNLTQKEVLRIPTTLVYASLPFVVRYEYVLGSEGIYHSFLTFSIWTLYKSYLRNNKMLILSGVFLTMAYNIRPLTIVMFPAFLLYILLISIDSPWKKVTSFLSSLILFESIWIPINYFVYRKPYITLKYHFAPGIDSTEWWRISELLRSVGDNYYWFYYSSYKLPQRAYTSDFGPREEKHLVALLKGYYADSIPEIAVVRYALAWEQSIKREKPFLYYILSRFYSTMNFLTSHLQEHVVYTPFWRVGGIHAIIYLYSMVIWSVVIGGGLILSLYYLLKWRDYPFMAFLGLSGNIGWAAYAALGLIQSRYILMGLVFLMALVTAAIGRIKSDISPNHR